MKMNDYQSASGATAIYPGQGEALGLAYVTLGLAGEAGEIANKVKKILRDNNGVISNEVRNDLLKESGDVLWYLARLVDELGGHLGGVADENLRKLLDRQRRGVLTGSGDTR